MKSGDQSTSRSGLFHPALFCPWYRRTAILVKLRRREYIHERSGQVSRQAFLGLLDHHCGHDQPILTSATAHIIIGVKITGEGYMGKLFARHRLYSHPEVVTLNEKDDNGKPQIDARKVLLMATSLQDARRIVSQALVNKWTYTYRLIAEDTEIDPQAPLYTFGVDPLLPSCASGLKLNL
ncbi:hypothetical protein AWENTII_010752 [Aspergillus wentii]|nr:hypothetical protein MW887_009905 [Aspergillus wentii]